MLLKAIAPYTRVTLAHLASELNGISLFDVEDLLVSLILDGKVDGKIDQVWYRQAEGGIVRDGLVQRQHKKNMSWSNDC